MNAILWVILFGFGLWFLLCLANGTTQNYCRCIIEPRGDDDNDDKLL